MKQKMERTVNKVFIITTKGCEACNVLNNIMSEVIKASKVSFEFVTKDVSEVDKTWLKQNKVKDFPTTFLIQNDSIRHSFVGTLPFIVILRYINVLFHGYGS